MPKLAGVSPAGALIVRAGEPKVVHVRLVDAAGKAQPIAGRTFVFVVRLASQTAPAMEPIAGILSGDGGYVTLALTAAQATKVYELGRVRAISYDLVETTAGASVSRWTERVMVEAGPDLPNDIVPVWADLPVTEVVIAPDVVVVSEMGPVGPGAERRLFDGGLIADDTLAAMDERYAKPAKDAAAAAGADVAGSILDLGQAAAAKFGEIDAFVTAADDDVDAAVSRADAAKERANAAATDANTAARGANAAREGAVTATRSAQTVIDASPTLLQARDTAVEARTEAQAAAIRAQQLAFRFADSDDDTYLGYLIDASLDQNIIARFRRDTGALEFIYDATLSRVVKLVEDADDPVYLAFLVDQTVDQNILGRFRRDTGAFEFVYDATLARTVTQSASTFARVPRAMRPSGERLQGAFRRWLPPAGTISIGADTTLTNRFLVNIASPAPFRFFGGPVADANGFAAVQTLRGGGLTGTLGANGSQIVGRMAFRTASPKVQINMGANGQARIYVDGLLISPEVLTTPTSGLAYIGLTFPTAEMRRIDIEWALNGGVHTTRFTDKSVWLMDGYTIEPIDESNIVRIAVQSDSYGDGAGSSFSALGWAFEFGRQMGGVDVDLYSESRGGTGYINAGAGGRTNNSAATGYAGPYTAGDPVRLDNIAFHQPHLLVMALGTNDDGTPNAATDLKPAVLYTLQQHRARSANLPIVVFGPWPASSGPSASKVNAENLIRAAVDQFADPLCVFVPVCTATPKPWWYGTGYSGNKKGEGPSDWMIGGTTGNDSVHPPDAGHRAIGVRGAIEVFPLLRNFVRL